VVGWKYPQPTLLLQNIAAKSHQVQLVVKYTDDEAVHVLFIYETQNSLQSLAHFDCHNKVLLFELDSLANHLFVEIYELLIFNAKQKFHLFPKGFPHLNPVNFQL